MSETITIGDVPVYVSKPKDEVKAGLMVIHEVWGMNDHIRDVADRFAKEGYLVYAPDLLSNTGIEEQAIAQLQQDLFNPERKNAVQPKLRELMAPIQAPDFAAKTVNTLKTVFEQLYRDPAVRHKVAVLGFCFGGTYSYSLAVAEPRLIASIPFYGHSNQSANELANIQAPILAFYGEKDEALVSALPELENRMREAKVDFNYRVYSNCGHAFFNDTNPYSYNKDAAQDAWKRTLEFLSKSANL
jgi:carboxymethylenebutenolidase